MGGTQMGAGMGAPAVTVDPSLAVAGAGAAEAAVTDDQILDTPAPGTEGTDAGDAGDQGTQDAGDKGTEGKGQEVAEEDLPLEGVEVPPAVKALFAQPGVGPVLKTAWYTLAGYREVFPTVAAAREIAKVIPSAEAARAAVEARDSLEQFDDLFYSGEAEKQKQFAETLFKEDPDGASAVATHAFDMLAKYNPGAYRQTADNIVLTMLHNLNRAASERPDDPQMANRMKAYDVVSWALFGKPLAQVLQRGAQSDPRDQELSAREQKLRADETKYQETVLSAFHRDVNDTAVEAVIGNISTAVQKLIADSGYKVTEGAQRELVGKVYSKLDAAMRADRDLRASMRRTWKDGEMDAEHKQRVVDSLTKAARIRMRTMVQSVFDDWTTNVLGLNRQRQDKQRQAQSRTDITGGRAPSGNQQGRVSTGNVRATQVNYGQTTDDDILSGSVAVRK